MPPSKSSKTDTSMETAADRIKKGFHIDRDIFFRVWFDAALKGKNVKWMADQITAKCSKHKGEGWDNTGKEARVETIRSKMNYYKNQERKAKRKDKKVSLPPVVRDEIRSLEEISLDWTAAKEKYEENR